MPVVGTKAAASAQGFGEFAQAGTTATYIEDVFSTYLYTGNGNSQGIPNGIALGTAYGGSGFFNGTSSYLTTPVNAAFDLGTGDFTMEAFFIYRAATARAPIVSMNHNALVDGWFRLSTADNAGGAYVKFVARSSGSFYQAETTVTWNSGWNSIAVTRSGGTLRLFANGTLVLTDAGFSGVLVGSSSYGMRVGQNYYDGDYFNGNISNLRVVKGSALYTSSYTPSTTPLTAVSGTSLLTCQANGFVDASANAFTITNSGAFAITNYGPFTDLTAGKGGLVWVKKRSAVQFNILQDTARGAGNLLYSNSTAASSYDVASATTFTSSGFATGSDNNVNESGQTYASWTFRKQPKFFDVVTYTGNGVLGRTISPNLGSAPGFMVVKCTSSAADWPCYHRALGPSYSTLLNLSDAAYNTRDDWVNGSLVPTAPTATQFTVSDGFGVNANGQTYVAYLFAHNAGGFGDDGTENVISCGSYTGNGSTSGPVVDLGYEPQWLLVKLATNLNATTSSWFLYDNMRGMPTGGSDAALLANTTNAEFTSNGDVVDLTSTGFQLKSSSTNNLNGDTYIYIAIRRGPMKTPTSGTSVFYPATATQAINSTTPPPTTTFPVDLGFYKNRTSTGNGVIFDRLRGNPFSKTNLTDAESGNTFRFDKQNGWYVAAATWESSSSWAFYNFRRAPGFFDVVCYTGTGSDTTFNHNLGVAPELMIVKSRSSAYDWAVYYGYRFGGMNLNSTAAEFNDAGWWANTAPTSSVFTVGNSQPTNNGGDTYIAYLFASCPGVSKVGSYTGTASTQTISCGFAARFVLIKRANSTGNWFVWDTARGMVAGTDPRLGLNLTTAEVNNNFVYTDASGFQIVTTDANVNASGGSYIYLAIA